MEALFSVDILMVSSEFGVLDGISRPSLGKEEHDQNTVIMIVI